MFDKDRSKNRKEAQVQEEVSVVEAREASERQEFTARSVSYFGPGMQLSGDVTVAGAFAEVGDVAVLVVGEVPEEVVAYEVEAGGG